LLVYINVFYNEATVLILSSSMLRANVNCTGNWWFY